jgi:hypothetical protein
MPAMMLQGQVPATTTTVSPSFEPWSSPLAEMKLNVLSFIVGNIPECFVLKNSHPHRSQISPALAISVCHHMDIFNEYAGPLLQSRKRDFTSQLRMHTTKTIF